MTTEQTSGGWEIWARLAREPDIAFAAFVVYRNHPPPRSLYALAAELGLPVGSIQKWSEKWNWIERADAYAEHIGAHWIDANEEVIARRGELAMQLHEIGRDLLQAAHYRLTGASDDEGTSVVRGLHPDELSASDVARFLDLGTRLARTSTGLPAQLDRMNTVGVDDLNRVFAGFLELTEKRMPHEEHEALVRDTYAMLQKILA